MTIDLLVINYNTEHKLRRFIDIVNINYGLHPDTFKLYVADNGSTDGSVEMLKTLGPQHNIEQIVYNTNVGYAAAANNLAAMSSSDILAVLNADTWMHQHALRMIQQAFDEDPEVAILGPKQRDEQGNITHAGIFGVENAPKHRSFRTPDPQNEMYREKEECLTVSGSAYFIRRNVWEDLTQCAIYQEYYKDAVGAFLPTPHYFEETWCSYHARAHGHKVFYDGRVSIGHTWHASSKPGGEADQMFPISQRIFREMCDLHSIPHD